MSRHSYGTCRLNGRTTAAHRAAWILTVGPIPAGLLACHRCDNKLCVRPAHIFLGTAVDNQQDWSRKVSRMNGSRPAYQYRARDRDWKRTG